jgi:hypothetical protein
LPKPRTDADTTYGEKPPAERSDRIPPNLRVTGTPSERSERTRAARLVIDDEQVPGAAAASAILEIFEGAFSRHREETREEINRVVTSRVIAAENEHLSTQLTTTTGRLKSSRRRLRGALVTLALAACAYLTERLTAPSIADRTAEVAVEKTAERVEEAASAAAVPIAVAAGTTTQDAAERAALQHELAELRAELAALREQKATPPKPKKAGGK